jgi:hypothetical protein
MWLTTNARVAGPRITRHNMRTAQHERPSTQYQRSPQAYSIVRLHVIPRHSSDSHPIPTNGYLRELPPP